MAKGTGSDLKLAPVRRYPAPALPTREVVDTQPELLRLLPKRWQGNAAVATALAACLAISSPLGAEKSAPDVRQAGRSLVAPLFHHGQLSPNPTAARDDYGAFGCMTVAPPRYLTEHDAEQALKDEAARAGLRFRARLRCLNDVEVPREPSSASGDSDPKAAEQKPELFTVHFDGADTQHGIVYEYVSDSDLANWKVKGTTESTAQLLRQNLVKRNAIGTIAVFYGPDMVSGTTEEDVRQQMRDFIVWLKAQGVI